MLALTLLYSPGQLESVIFLAHLRAYTCRPGWFRYEEPPLCETLCSMLGVQRQQVRKNCLVRQGGEPLFTPASKAEQDVLKFEASLGYL